MVRATPHPTTGKSPAELMYGRKYRTRIPEISMPNPERQKLTEEARQRDHEIKQKQKTYKDNKPYVKEHQINIGDTVLLKQKKTKMSPPYDPDPFTVTDVRGHQIKAERRGKIISRDAQKWKPYSPMKPKEHHTAAANNMDSDEDDIDFDDNFNPTDGVNSKKPAANAQHQTRQDPVNGAQIQQPRRNPPRQRNQPDRYGYK